VPNEVTDPNMEWSMMARKSSHRFMKTAKTILPHTVQPILTSNKYSELANLQGFSSSRESLDNPGDVRSTISSSEYLISHTGLLNMENSSSYYHQNLPQPRSESLVDGFCELYQICSIPTILNGQITDNSKGEIISSVYHKKGNWYSVQL